MGLELVEQARFDLSFVGGEWRKSAIAPNHSYSGIPVGADKFQVYRSGKVAEVEGLYTIPYDCNSIAIHPSGEQLALLTASAILIVDANGRLHAELPVGEEIGVVECLSFDPTGKYLLAGTKFVDDPEGSRARLLLLGAENVQLIHEVDLEGDPDSLYFVEWAPLGDTFSVELNGGENGATLNMLRIEDGRLESCGSPIISPRLSYGFLPLEGGLQFVELSGMEMVVHNGVTQQDSDARPYRFRGGVCGRPGRIGSSLLLPVREESGAAYGLVAFDSTFKEAGRVSVPLVARDPWITVGNRTICQQDPHGKGQYGFASWIVKGSPE